MTYRLKLTRYTRSARYIIIYSIILELLTVEDYNPTWVCGNACMLEEQTASNSA